MKRKLQNWASWLGLDARSVGVSVGIATLVGLLNFAAEYSLYRSYELPLDVPARFFDELVGTWSILVPLPFLFKFFSAFPLTQSTWPRRLPIYLGAMVAMGLAHTTVMLLVREAAYPVFGFGEHDPGELSYRYAMEIAKASPGFWVVYIGHQLFRRLKEKQEAAIRVVALQREASEARLESLKTKLNPHFLFNTLNLVSSVMYEDLAKADRLLSDLGSLLRYTLSFEDAQFVRLQQEVELLERYLAIVRSRFGDRLSVTCVVEDGLSEVSVPVFCLQPLVENAVKFSVDQLDRQGVVEIRMQSEGPSLGIRVVDNGIGLTANSDGTQVGLKTLRERLETLYAGKAILSLRAGEENGTVVELKLPLRSEVIE